MTISTKIDLGGFGICTHHHYIGYMPQREEMEERGWDFTTMGAEGPYYRKGDYDLQIVQQGPGNQSVINLNKDIEGYQNCYIGCKGIGMIFFGYINSLAELDAVLQSLNKTQ